jgi:hypothetical protein
MNQELIIVKRKTRSQLRTFNESVLKLELKNSRFILSQKAADILCVDSNKGIMFAFNMKDKKAFICKDDEDDAFILKRKDAYTLRFSSKDVANYFIDTFDLLSTDKQTFIFYVSSMKNDKNMFCLRLK